MRTSKFAWPWIAALLVLFSSTTSDAGEDWPMWRYDAQRSAASPNSVPERLQTIWKRDLAPRQPAWDDPLNLDLMTYDRTFEPIAIDGRLLIGFNDSDKLLAIDAQTGKDLWTAYAEAPVRLAPVAWKDRVFFSSDDGYLYCVQALDGKLLWKFSGAPNPQKVIGNRRLTSAWPARGGPVVRDDTVYFAASIWPFMGTFLYAIDAETGAVRWVNDNTGSQYIKQPHSAPSFAGVAPQGAIVATENALVVPGGRSVPAVFDRHSGELRYFELNAGGKGTGGSFVSASDEHFYVHTRLKGTRAFDLATGVKTAFMPNEPVLVQGIVYSAEVRDDTPLVRASRPDGSVLWEVQADGSGDLILAGDRLVAGGSQSITLIRLPEGEQPAEIIGSTKTQSSVDRLLVADHKLFAVSIDGSITAYGDQTLQGQEPAAVAATQAQADDQEKLECSEQDRQRAAKLLAATDAQGYAFWFGEVDTGLVSALAEASPFVQLAIVDDD
ncbi:MAG: PQQ-binding-like beta-propeller repeat protein, partial [Planctomycetaceae bacterium]